ncbi:hypothetical protein M8J76_001284 [Diaphorina citri]|nr:hypothetical protein M8J76_001284 [Diaphorina citri]
MAIAEKIQHLQLNRSKRGILKGLGTAIKFITGNLDHNDGEQFKSAINVLRNSEQDVEKQVQQQYSINNQLMLIFNNSIQNIQYIEKQLQAKLDQLEDASDPGLSSTIN